MKQFSAKSYSNLVTNLKKVFIDGLQRIEEEKVKVYWNTGRLISEFVLGNKSRADYGGNIFKRLSEDLHIELSLLQKTVQFYRTYPNSGALPNLSWLHCLKLVTLKDKGQRELLAETAVRKDWGYRELAEAIRLEKLEVETPVVSEKPEITNVKLSVVRARLFTYRILEPGYITGKEESLVIDLGFSNNVEIDGEILHSVQDDVKDNVIVESEKNGKSYVIKRSDAKPKELFVYAAQVERVVDGDTVWLNIDCGFKVWTRQKVRLRGIDCPEMDCDTGKEAKRFVESKLKDIGLVVVKTYKSDKYNRYLTDVFYSKDEILRPKGAQDDPQTTGAGGREVLEKGIFLNQELLDLSLAKLWEE